MKKRREYGNCDYCRFIARHEVMMKEGYYACLCEKHYRKERKQGNIIAHRETLFPTNGERQ